MRIASIGMRLRPAEARSMPLRAGVRRVDITPVKPVWMGGYAYRDGPSLGVRDPLYATALALDDEDGAGVMLISADLVACTGITVEVRARLSAELGLPISHIMLCASHTHSGPLTQRFLGMGEFPAEYAGWLVERLTEAASAARNALVPVSLHFGKGTCEANRLRRVWPKNKLPFDPDPAPDIDRSAAIILLTDLGAKPIAAVYSYAMHPVTLGGSNRLFSADWVGSASRHIEARIGVPVVFLQGCAGEINPTATASPEATEQIGTMVGVALVRLLDALSPIESSPLRACSQTAELPTQPLPPRIDLEAELAAAIATRDRGRAENVSIGHRLENDARVEYAAKRCAWGVRGVPKVRTELQLFEIGRCRVLAIGAEPFSAYGRDFVTQTGDRPLIVAGYANSVFGYLPTAADFRFGGYEVSGAEFWYDQPRLASGCERAVREAVYDLLNVSTPDWTPYLAGAALEV